MNNELVSVIIPAYNCEKFIQTCIESILNQSHTNLEVLISDDGSQDRTRFIVNSFTDSRVKTFHNDTNKGVVSTRNMLISHCRAKFIALQDADDWSDPLRIEQQLNKLLSNKSLVACGTGYVKTDAEGRELHRTVFEQDHKKIREYIPEQFELLCGSVMFRSDKLGQEPYNTFFGNSGNEDLYLMGKLIIDYKFSNIPAYLYYYRYNSKSITKLGSANDVRRHYIMHLTQQLLNEYKLNGTNDLEENNLKRLVQLETKYSSFLLENKEELFEKNTGQLLYWKDYRNAIIQSFYGIIDCKCSPKSIKIFLYTLRKSIVR